MEQDLIRIISTGQIYLYLFGQYWYIVDMPTLYGVFGSNPDVTDVTSLPSDAQLGPQISGGSCLFQPLGSAAVYFLCASNQTAYLITSMTALSYYQFNGPLQTCTNQVLNDWLLMLLNYGANIDAPSTSATAPRKAASAQA